MFTPDQAFLKLVKREIGKLGPVCLDVVQAVRTELVAIAKTAGDQEGLKDYPQLQNAVNAVLMRSIQEQAEAATVLVKTLIKMESSR